MKPENENPRPPTLPTEAGCTALDWPREAGHVDEFLAKVKFRVRRRRRRIVGASSVAALGLLVAVWGVPYVRDTTTLATRAAHRQELALTDGSRIELNAQTSLHADFRYGRRFVRLERGEAFFTVAKDAAHPFFVETSAGTIQVTGTQFNVRLADSGRAEVTLMEGSVTVQRATAATEKLVPGEQLAFGAGGSNLRALPAEALENTMAWRQGRIVLDGLTLAEASARLAEFHGRRISVAPEVAGLHPGGVFPLDDLNGFLAALETALSVKVLTASDGSYRIVAGVPR